MQIKESSKQYDVCIIGSGAGGGMAAHELTKAGADVVMLEAGGWFDSEEFAMFTWPYESPRRGASTRRQPFGEFDACFGGWDIEGEPYSSTEGTDFDWFRGRMLGGRTNHWGRISLRFGPDDFRVRSIDGMGDDWPISYEELKPYYDRIDRLIGVFGTNEGIYNEPGGIFQPPPEPRCYEHLIKDACDDMGIPCIPSRLSILTEPKNGRAACHYCGQCNRSCSTHSNFSSPSVLLPPALETGNLEIITHAMAREITHQDGKATGVSYVNKEDGKEYKVRARIVVLAASACESARLLLNSKSSEFPDGLANSSGKVGKYLMDTTGTSVAGVIPQLMDSPPHNEDGTGGMHLYIPWWGDNSKLDFARGYHVELWGGRGMPSYGFMGGIQNYSDLYQDRPNGGGGYGKQLKEDYRRYYGSIVGLSGRGESIGYEDNYCEIDPNSVDEWGIPTLRFNYTWSDQEYRQVRHMQQTFRQIIGEMGGQPLWDMPGKEDGYGISTPGEIIHEVGTTRMGDDPSTSVLNKYCQAHDVDNLFVADGGPFVSQPHKNTTWTLLALSMRTSNYIADQMNKGNL
ncbi:GMC family oxidoreductase [Aliifodinibius sp. S!AR15-10]|uniref:GMC family oxidoreductase n=1 Tax=Aliifodinibius sp. S!AR15-10 TaxID=2950437 RepID=UPI00285518FC|nr:GMC family oxidoreductase [Aliifodinibius sp. S!AR15-10]MDR8392522.1 GMC family oxidoreductase [Aliifodinibius sp. S!AR15-10]